MRSEGSGCNNQKTKLRKMVKCLVDIDSSLPAKSSASPSSLLHIPEEDLPFPEAGLPSSMQSSPATSLTNSPFPSLPSTPPLSRNTSTPPQAAPSTRGHNTDRADSHSELLQRVTERVQEPVLERPKPSRSSSIDFGSALSKVKSMALHGGQSMGQKVVKGFLSSLSTPSHDQGSSGQPVLYRNSDVQYPPSATPTAGVISPSSSVERGEFASMASPLSDHSDLNDWVTPPPSSPPPQAYTPHQDTLAFTNTSMETRSGPVDEPTPVCHHCWPVPSLLACALIAGPCPHCWPVPSLLACAIIAGPCPHCWLVPSLLARALIAGPCSHCWPVLSLLARTLIAGPCSHCWPVLSLLARALIAGPCSHCWPVLSLLARTLIAGPCPHCWPVPSLLARALIAST